VEFDAYDAGGWITEGHLGCRNLAPVIPRDSLLGDFWETWPNLELSAEK